MNKIYKYESSDFEPHASKYIFNPIAEFLLPIFYALKFTPNFITLVSCICTLICCYCIVMGNLFAAGVFYFLGFMFDCADGLMARKYKMYSKFGEAFDCSTDMITGFVMAICSIYYFRNIYPPIVIFLKLLVVFITLVLSYSINEAILVFKKEGHDNYYLYKKQRFKDQKGVIYKIYLEINKTGYKRYKFLFPNETLKSLLHKINYSKWVGDGNLSLLITIYLISHSNLKKYLNRFLK
jgi:phosphatidylglycerophosphate synthase